MSVHNQNSSAMVRHRAELKLLRAAWLAPQLDAAKAFKRDELAKARASDRASRRAQTDAGRKWLIESVNTTV